MTEYERVRSVATHFAIVPGHDVVEVERVVEQVDGRYAVVEKIEIAGEIATPLDPRGGGST